MELRICHLYPDALNLYGDRGNVTCLKKRLEWRGIDCAVEGCGIGQELDVSRYDIFLLGAGQEFERGLLLQDVMGAKAAQIKAAIEDEKVFLAVGSGFQLLGSYYETLEGKKYDLTGALDMYCVESRDRLTGDYLFECDDLPGTNVVAFENHEGRTWLGSGVRPVGKVICGHGNNGQDGLEGARYKNVFGTYGHGCLLPKNPAVADLLLSWALERKYPGATLSALEDAMEQKAHAYMEQRIRAAQNR